MAIAAKFIHHTHVVIFASALTNIYLEFLIIEQFTIPPFLFWDFFFLLFLTAFQGLD